MAELLSYGADGDVIVADVVRRVTSDSRQVDETTVYVDVNRRPDLRREHLRDAVARGAVGIVTDLDAQVDVPPSLPIVRVGSPRRMLAEIAASIHQYPARSLRSVGITGTSGKTTAVEYCLSVLQAAGEPCDAVGSLHPLEEGPTALTTPDASLIQAGLRRMRDEGVRTCVLEVSSHAIHQQRVAGIPFRAGLLTSLGRDHLDYHGSLQDYWQTKAGFFRDLGRDALAILPAESHVAAAIEPGIKAEIIRFGETHGDVRIKELGSFSRGHRRLHLLTPFGDVHTELNFPGGGVVRSAMLAATLGLYLGYSKDQVSDGIAQLSVIPGRMQRIPVYGRHVWIDYAHNPIGLEMCLKGVREATPGHIWLVFGGRGGRDGGKLPIMGAVAGRLADHVILTSDSPGDEDPRALADAIWQGLTTHDHVSFVLERGEAILRALCQSEPGDAIVITGRGPETTQVVGSEVRTRSDLELVQAAMQQTKGPHGKWLKQEA